MRDLFHLLLGSGLCTASLALWYATYKTRRGLHISYLQAMLNISMVFSTGLFGLAESGWLPGGVIVATWLVVGTMLSSIVNLSIYFLNWRDGKAKKPVEIVEPERIANR